MTQVLSAYSSRLALPDWKNDIRLFNIDINARLPTPKQPSKGSREIQYSQKHKNHKHNCQRRHGAATAAVAAICVMYVSFNNSICHNSLLLSHPSADGKKQKRCQDAQ
jgi:hypothetical protein